jgi:hypothetical protein
MDFLQKLLQGISFIPAVVNSIEGLFGNQPGQQKKTLQFPLWQRRSN